MEHDDNTSMARSPSEGSSAAINTLFQHACVKFEQYQETQDVGLLQEAIRLAHEAAQPTAALLRHPQRSELLESYHAMLRENLLLTEHPKDLVDCIMCMNQCLDFLPEQDPYAFTVVNHMTEITTHVPWIAFTAKVVEPGDVEGRDMVRSELLVLVSDVYVRRFKHTGSTEDLELSCQVLGQAVDCSPLNNPPLLDWCLMLGNRCRIVYERTARLEYVDARIEVIQKGVSLLSDHTASDKRAHVLEQYADGLQARAKRTGSIEDLTQAIGFSTDAVAHEPHPDTKCMYAINLANRLEDRFDRTGRLDDLHEAIRVDRASVALTLTDVTMSCTTLHNLGAKLFKLYRRSADERDFDEGFGLVNRAIESMPSLDGVPAIWLNSASSGFRHHYLQHHQENDLEKALQYQRMAIERLPRGHVELPGYLNNMAWLMQMQAAASRNFEEFVEAVQFSEQALDVIPEGHVHQAGVLYSLARVYTTACINRNHGILEVEVDGVRWTPFWEDKALELYLKCLDCLSGNPTVRMGAATQAMVILEKRGQYAEATAVGVKGLEVLHKTNSRSLSREDQERITAEFSDVAVETCALSLSAGNGVARALEILEMGRGAILGLLIEERSDISELAASYPAEAARFRELRDEIRAPLSVGVDVASRQELVARRDRSVAELDDLLQRIRALPNQRAFLRGPSEEDLKRQAEGGPIVVVNVAGARTDAIIVSTSDIRSIPLPEMTKTKVIEWIAQEPTRWKSRPERGRKNNLYRDFLQWLWTVCVQPILQTLGVMVNPTSTMGSSSLSRVWWIGAGVASLLPFHAAGDHSPGSTANTYSHVISSYAPTIKALRYAKERAALQQKTITSHQPPVLLVALMPTSPAVNGQHVGDLRVDDEFAAIDETVGSTYAVRRMSHPSCDSVLEGLANCDMVHFACHGVSETKNPSSSYLILQQQQQQQQQADNDPDSIRIADKLTVQMVSQAVFGRARICYLSACSTAENRSVQLADEVIHLASGFQVAGFPHVIGALWPSDDAASVQIAKVFYRQLSAEQMPCDDDDDHQKTVASALREAVMSVRARYPRQPLLWAQYVHIGA